MDLNKLTPAPWLISAPASDQFPAVVKQTGFPILLSEEDNVADLQFAALARNAFDVMMRRGWWPISQGPGTQWLVVIPDVNRLEQGGGFVDDDPFTALIEADRWYRETQDPA